MKKIVLSIFVATVLLSNVETVVAQKGISSALGNLTQDQIGRGLKEALDKGVQDQVDKLTKVDGFYKNELVKIVMPSEAQKVEKTLRSMGMGVVVDQATELVNRAAENAVKEATPIFLKAISNLSFADASAILLGGDSAATNYLKDKTSKELAIKFEPIIKESLSKVGADQAWDAIFSKYNALPLVKDVNPNLTEYVTQKTMEGVFTMIAVEENDIRKNLPGTRSTPLLKEVFSKQDNTTSTSTNTKKGVFSIFNK